MTSSQTVYEGTLTKAVDKVFECYDSDKNNTLEPDELRKLISDGYKKLRTGRTVNDDDVRRFMESCQTNESGRISKEDLIKTLKHISEEP